MRHMETLRVPEEDILHELEFCCLLHIILSPKNGCKDGITKCLLRHPANEHEMLRSKMSFFSNTSESSRLTLGS